MPQPIPPTEPRSLEELRRHYEIEKELATRLRQAAKAERPHLYNELYDELFQRVPELKEPPDPAVRAGAVALEAQALTPFLADETVFLEVGAGDCALALSVVGASRRVIAVEASAEVTAGVESPPGFELRITEGGALPLENGSVDVAYSCHFLEHLHPEDALDHLADVRRVLRPGGAYLVITPNALWGPHDISRYFDEVATGFHLQEHTHVGLARAMRGAGFARTSVLRGIGRPPELKPLWPHALVETMLGALPAGWARSVLEGLAGQRGAPPFRPLEQVKVVGFA